ncbi:MAG: hypothetical protein DCC75_07495 [Proteobacteria bacterium]|nr:MAG: hypothetical protein DCC75_07495 [Pseudomonadota bacterium]
MGRPIYQHELGDPDFNWLISRFMEKNPDYQVLDSSAAPVILIKHDKPLGEIGYLPPQIPEASEPSILGEEQE